MWYSCLDSCSLLWSGLDHWCRHVATPFCSASSRTIGSSVFDPTAAKSYWVGLTRCLRQRVCCGLRARPGAECGAGFPATASSFQYTRGLRNAERGCLNRTKLPFTRLRTSIAMASSCSIWLRCRWRDLTIQTQPVQDAFNAAGNLYISNTNGGGSNGYMARSIMNANGWRAATAVRGG